MSGRELRADCARCVALCCVAPAFQRSAEFAITKPAGVACPHLAGDDRCRIHTELRGRGFAGCAAYDCFGAGQRVSAGAQRSPQLFAVFGVVRQLHELLWYLEEARELAAGTPLRAQLEAARDRVDALAGGDHQAILAVDPGAERDLVRPLLLQAVELSGVRRADYRGADLIGADLRGADLRGAIMIGADLRGAQLAGADLSTAVYLTQNQVGAAQGDPATRIPARLERPAHWNE